MTTAPTNDVQIALNAATAAAAVLPSAEPLTPGTPLAGGEGVAEPFAGAVIADFEGEYAGGRVAVLVGDDLVAALAASPLGGLDLAAALQPGDAIRLNHPSSAPLEVVVDGINFAHATAGTSGFRLAALIVGTPKETS